MASMTLSQVEVGAVGGEIIRTEATRMQVKTEKDKNRVEERLQDLETQDIEYLIDEAKTHLKATKLKQAWERRCQRVSYSNLQTELGLQKDSRNLKLYSTYQKEWKGGRQKALIQMSKGLTTGLTKKRESTVHQK